MDNMFNDEDLYGDLESSIFHTHSTNHTSNKTRGELEAKNSELESLLEKTMQEKKELASKLKKTERNYNILLLNARCLEKTTKAELERKNALIAKLARDLDGLSKKIRPSWNTEEKCPAITRPDLTNMSEAIKMAYIEAGDIKTSQIRQSLAEQLQNLNSSKVKEKKSTTVAGHKIKLGNVHMYFFEQQCDFKRKEEVVLFPQKHDPPPSAPGPDVGNLSMESSKVTGSDLTDERKDRSTEPSATTTKIDSKDSSSATRNSTDGALTQSKDEIKSKSSTPDGTCNKELRSSRDNYRRTSEYSHYHKRRRSSSREQAIRHVRLRTDDRGRDYEHYRRDHQERRYDQRRDRDPPHYSSKSGH